MSLTHETRRVAMQGSPDRVPAMSFERDGTGYNPELCTCQELQATHLQRRFVMSDALARAVAELAFARRPAR